MKGLVDELDLDLEQEDLNELVGEEEKKDDDDGKDKDGDGDASMGNKK